MDSLASLAMECLYSQRIDTSDRFRLDWLFIEHGCLRYLSIVIENTTSRVDFDFLYRPGDFGSFYTISLNAHELLW